jgi:hypothetical protein
MLIGTALNPELRHDRLAQFPMRGVGGFHGDLHFQQFGVAAKIVSVHAAKELVEVISAPPQGRQHLHAPFDIGAK